MPNYYADPNAFQGATDSQRIQQAVDAAARTGSRMVVIPAYNARTGTCLWEIEETIELPSHIYVEINNAHLRLKDGVYCQMFRNANAFLGPITCSSREALICAGFGRESMERESRFISSSFSNSRC